MKTIFQIPTKSEVRQAVKKIRVGVFYGGRSVEHEVSVISALQVMHALDRSKYEVIPIYMSKKEMWYTGQPLLEINSYQDMETLLARCERVVIANSVGEKQLLKYPPGLWGKKVVGSIDVAFPVIHGTNGEDGTLQGFLESIDIPYVGSNVTASALGMDKIMTKKVLAGFGLPVLDFHWFYAKEWLVKSDEVMDEIEKRFSYPLIVKPANLGSSIGVSRADNRQELYQAVDLAARFAPRILVEEMITKVREINCSVLGDYEKVTPSVLEEPVSSQEILTYQDKYLSGGLKGMGGAQRRLPAELSEEKTALIKRLACETFLALGCSGVARVDFLLDEEKDLVYVNEINTIPGSLSFYLWEAAGLSFQELLDELIRLAFKAYREKNELVFSYEANVLALKGPKGVKNLKQ